MSDVKALAINGGTPAVKPYPKGRFHFGKEEKAAVDAMFDEAIQSGNAPGYNGPQETAFCKEFAAYVGAGYADGVNSGTTAVFVALKALDLPLFSEVVVGCVTDCGGIMPVVMNNCIPVVADTMPNSFSSGPAEIEARITPRTSAIVVAHISGYPTDIEGIAAVAKKHNLPLVEDCAQALGARVNGKHVGTFGTLGAFSLMFGKHICTGGQGGAVVTNDEEMYWKVRRAADRGKPFNLTVGSNVLPSLNFNLDEFHAAIGRVQIQKLDWIVAERRKVVDYLKKNIFGKLKGVRDVSDDLMPKGGFSSYWKAQLLFNPEGVTCTKEEYCKALQAEGVPMSAYYWIAYQPRQNWYQKRAETFPWNAPQYKGDKNAVYPCPNAEKMCEDCLFFLVQENTSEETMKEFGEAFLKVDAAFAK